MKKFKSPQTQKIALATSGFIILGILGISLSSTGQVWSEKIKYQLTQLQSQKIQANNFSKTPIKVERKSSLLGDVRKAQALITSQQYEPAIQQLQQVIAKEPRLMYPYVLLGEIYLQTSNISQLSGLIKEIERVFSANELATILTIRKDIADNNFLAASTALKTLAFEKDLKDVPADVLFYYGTFAAMQNDHETAQEVFKILDRMPVKKLELILSSDGLKDESNDKDANNYISPHIAQKVSDLGSLYQEFEQVSDGEMPHLLVLIGKKLAENNEAVLAQGFAEIALQEKNDYTDAWIVRGYSYYIRKQYDKALEDFNTAYKLDPIRPENHYFLALTLTELGRDAEAALYYEKVLEQSNFGFQNDLKWRLVDVLLRQKKYDQVVTIYQELANDTAEIEKFIAPIHQLLELAQRPELAVELAQTLYENNKEDLLALNLYGWTLIANDQSVQAQSILQKALKLDAENPRTHFNLGLIKEKEQKFTEAAEHYKTAYDYGKLNRVYAAIANMAAESYNRLSLNILPGEVENIGRTQNSP